MSRRYLTDREAADYVSSSPSTLAKRRMTGDGPVFYRLGRAIRYTIEDLDNWMSLNAARSTSDRPAKAA